MGRVLSETDPLSNQYQYEYDTQGRISRILYPGNATQSITYDNAGNITRISYSANPDLQFAYDPLERLISANSIAFTRDAEGRITGTSDSGLSFGAVYDDGGRLKTVTYNNGAFTVTYGYDASTGLLKSVADSLTNTTVTFAYDADLRLTGITRPNSVNSVFDYDKAARLIRIRDGNFVDVKYTLDEAGQVTQADMTAPLLPHDAISRNFQEFAYDAASQISTSGYVYDAEGRMTASPAMNLTWDGASCLTGIGDVNLSYNGLGDLLTRDDVRYFYNYAVDMNPIMAEKNESGGFLRYYVWTPGGQLLYMIDAANGNKVYFYHFDRTGSTLALTDSAGAITDKYAYDPYGKMLGHEGANPQPFTFVGRFGIRQEGNLYQMRARYYDPGTLRFLSRDQFWPRVRDFKELNPYLYAQNNPAGWIDPTGMSGYPLSAPVKDDTPIGDVFGEKLYGTRETSPKKDKSPGLGDTLLELAADKAQEKIEEDVKEKALEKLKKEALEKIEKKYGKKMAMKVAKKLASLGKLAGPAATALEGFSSAYEIGGWIGMSHEEFVETMREQTSYQVVEALDQNRYTQPVVRAVGSVVNTVVESNVTHEAYMGVGSVVSWILGD